MHQAQGRLCRWLVFARDRVAGEDLPFTQELVADLLGLRRTTVSMIAHVLHTEGIISVRRGHIHIRDMLALERNACTCCREIRSLSDVSPPSSIG
jgi:CRP-like cAMP-binding protein